VEKTQFRTTDVEKAFILWLRENHDEYETIRKLLEQAIDQKRKEYDEWDKFSKKSIKDSEVNMYEIASDRKMNILKDIDLIRRFSGTLFSIHNDASPTRYKKNKGMAHLPVKY